MPQACCVVSLARLRPVRGRRTRVKHVTSLTGLDEAFHHNWYPSKAVVMADRRDWGGGGDDPEELTKQMIERIWESLTNIWMRKDQQAPVPPVIGEAVLVAPVPPPPGVEVPFVAPIPPSPPVIAAEEPVVQIERFLRLQPPTYTGGPNPDTAEHWIHEIERVFMTMRCPAADRVLLATYQLRGFAQEWWRLKMQTTFPGRIEGAISWLEFLEMRFMALSRYAPYVVTDNAMMVEYFIRGLRPELQTAVIPLMCRTVEEAAQIAATLERAVRTRQVSESALRAVGVGKATLRESGTSRGNTGRSLHNAFFAKVVTSKAHPYSPQARARRRFLYRRPVRSRDVVVLAQHLQQCSFSFFSCTCCTSGRRAPHSRELEEADSKAKPCRTAASTFNASVSHSSGQRQKLLEAAGSKVAGAPVCSSGWCVQMADLLCAKQEAQRRRCTARAGDEAAMEVGSRVKQLVRSGQRAMAPQI
ncbi:hypothetical protein Taro_021120 [Colocasia esculenta]|uniref:Retrotransposon gag domain-containing protein n=1 Tax=Colocasia esculenta TaxID=4460 RepID=A0A843V4F4_COLES|nr:hypothetical protein [Colocasia esculenta]